MHKVALAENPRPVAAPTIRRSSPHTPLSFIAVGILSLLAGIFWLALRPEILATYHYNQHVIAVTHLFTLGWICSVIMGAMYQLVPVALETKVHSESLARWHLVLHLAGFTGMVWMFWVWDVKHVSYFGAIFAAGVSFFVYNLGRTLATVPRWNVVATGIASALTWLALTVIAGLLLAIAKLRPISPFDPIGQMHAHAHLGGLGFFVMMIVAVSYKLIPMFTLSEIRNGKRAWASIWLLNAGLAGLFTTILLSNPLKLAFALIVISGLVAYGFELVAMLRSRKRRPLDWGLKYFLTAITLLIPLCLLALPLTWAGLQMTTFTGQLENVYGLVALLGVVTLAILGMLYKIVPFLVWYSSYSGEIGRAKVPALADLYSARLQVAGYWLFLVGFTLTTIATVVGRAEHLQWSLTVLAVSIFIFTVNMAKICTHLVHPKYTPIAPIVTRRELRATS